MRIHYPTWQWYTGKLPGMRGAPAWYCYLLDGLQQIADVEIDPAMDRLSASYLNHQYTCIDIEHDGGRCRAVYDWCDFSGNHGGVNGEDAYWKIMAHRDEAVLPIGQTVAEMAYLRELPRLAAESAWKTIDVLCLGRSTHYDMRCTAAEMLLAEKGLTQITGVAQYPRRPLVPEHLRRDLLPREEYYRMIARARVVVALPGVGGDWTWRHMEALAAGTCLVCPEGPYRLPGVHQDAWVEVSRDLSDLVPTVLHLVRHRGEREAIAMRGREYWDRELAPAQMAQRLVGGTIERSIP